jgi:hypothetical protein
MGDQVVYRKPKYSDHPGPRAQQIDPAPKGDKYSYVVDKFWVVVETLDDGSLVLQTRRGKTHKISSDDPRIHRATWWERLIYRSRFPQLRRDMAST